MCLDTVHRFTGDTAPHPEAVRAAGVTIFVWRSHVYDAERYIRCFPDNLKHARTSSWVRTPHWDDVWHP